jgi:hypothetical protein
MLLGGLFIKIRQNTPPLGAGMNGERGSRGCNPLERGFQRGCRPLWSRAGLMPRLQRAPARSVEDAKGGALLKRKILTIPIWI